MSASALVSSEAACGLLAIICVSFAGPIASRQVPRQWLQLKL